jgi:hypothetical protein
MKIEIKNIKINKSFSEETICFNADVFVDGKKTAYASNDGHGGCTFYNSYHKPNDDENLRQAEAYARTLPSHFYEYGDTKMEIKSDLEGIIDQIINDKFNEGEKAKANKQLVKDTEKNICFGVPNGGSYKMIGYKIPLRAVAMSEQGRKHLTDLYERVKRELKEGEVIFNKDLSVFNL